MIITIHAHDHVWDIRMPHAKLGLDPLKTVTNFGEQRTERFSFSFAFVLETAIADTLSYPALK